MADPGFLAKCHAVADPGFPIGGIDRGGATSDAVRFEILCFKTKELKEGGARRQRSLNPPMGCRLNRLLIRLLFGKFVWQTKD